MPSKRTKASSLRAALAAVTDDARDSFEATIPGHPSSICEVVIVPIGLVTRNANHGGARFLSGAPTAAAVLRMSMYRLASQIDRAASKATLDPRLWEAN